MPIDFRMMTRVFLPLLLMLLPFVAGAQQFRLDSQVMLIEDDRVIADNLTLFDNNVIFDFVFEPDGSQTPIEIVAFDLHEKKFVLLDVTRELRLELPQYAIVQMLEQLRSLVSEDEKTKWLLSRDFKEAADIDEGTLNFSGPRIQYKAKCQRPTDAAVQAMLFEFLDQFTMLAASDPRRMPPFARMQFNQTLKKYRMFPTEIELQIDGDGMAVRDLHVKSRHTLIDQLSDVDRERIMLAKKCWTSFRETTLEEYRNLPAVAKSGPSEKNTGK